MKGFDLNRADVLKKKFTNLGDSPPIHVSPIVPPSADEVIGSMGTAMGQSLKKTSPTSYCLKGFRYFWKHPRLYWLVFTPMIFVMGFFIATFYLLFKYSYELQYHALLKSMKDDYVSLVTLLIMLAECFFAISLFNFLILGFFRGMIVERVMEIEQMIIEDQSDFCTKLSVSIFLFILQFFLSIILLPIHAIPGIGSVFYFMLNGYFVGWDYFIDYFGMKGMTFVEQLRYMEAHRSEYFCFGGLAMFLNTLPVIGQLFSWTNVVAASLWICDLERQNRSAAVPMDAVFSINDG